MENDIILAHLELDSLLHVAKVLLHKLVDKDNQFLQRYGIQLLTTKERKGMRSKKLSFKIQG